MHKLGLFSFIILCVLINLCVRSTLGCILPTARSLPTEGIRLFHCSQSEVIPNFSSYSGSASTANEVFCQTISGIEAGNLEWFSPVNTKLLADNGASGDPFYVQELPSETQLQRNNAGWPIENGLYRCALMGIDDYEYIALFDDTVGNSDFTNVNETFDLIEFDDEFMLTFTVHTLPPTDLVCTLDGVNLNIALEQFNRTVVNASNPIEVLVEISLERSDVHTGTYECTVGADGTFPRMEALYSQFITVSPEGFVSVTGEENVENEAQLSLNCTSQDASPDNVFTWTLNGDIVMPSDTVTISSMGGEQSILTISSINATIHKGTYNCNVTNNVGSGEDSLDVVVSPVGIVTTPLVTVASSGDNVTFNCETDAGPMNSYVWLYNVSSLVCTESDCSDGIFIFTASDEEIMTASLSYEPTLTLNSVDIANGGEYVCVVINEAGIELSYSNLYILPEFIIQPQDILSDSGDTGVSFTCEAEAFPNPEYQWQFRNDNDPFTDISGAVASQYTFPQPISFMSAGDYQCVASITTVENTIHNVTSETAVLHVPPSGSVTIISSTADANGAIDQDGNVLIQQGGAFNIACSAQGGPNNIHTWSLGNTAIVSNGDFSISSESFDTRSESILRVTDIDAATHGGTYICSVSNAASSSPARATTTVTVSPEGLVATSPEIVIATEGMNITFMCETAVQDGQTVRYVWFHNVRNLVCSQSDCSDGNFDFNPTNEEVMNATVGISQTLMINDIAASSGGEYTCIVINDAGTGLSTSDLYVEPYFIEEPSDVELNYADRLVLSCDTEFTLQWQKFDEVDGQFVDLMEENETKLIFENALLENSGEYRCLIMNDINGSEVIINSTVATVIVNPISPNGNVMLDGPMFVRSEQQVSYNCSAYGGPNNTFEWMINGMTIENNMQYTINTVVTSLTSGNSELTVISVNPATDQGNYSCIVSNVGGSGEDSIIVTVSPEGILSTIPESQNASKGDNISFTCLTEAGPDTTYLWLYNISDLVCTESDCSDGIFDFTATIEEILEATLDMSATLNLNNVNAPDNGGEYLCAAANDAGIEISMSTLNFEPQFIEEPADTEVNTLSDSVSLRCRAEAFPFPTYQWQKRILGEFVDLINENGEVFVENDTQHNDAGLYRCIVNNTIDGYETTIISRIAIIYVTPNDSVMLSVTGSGNFVERNLYIEQEGDFQISCMAAGGPNNTHTWIQNGVNISNSDSFNISSSGNDTMSISILSVDSVDAAIHKGSYSCEVVNEAGDHIQGLTITVSPVGIVSITPESQIVRRGETISFNCSSDAGPTNNYLWLYRPSDLVCSIDNCFDNNFNFDASDQEVNETTVGFGKILEIGPVTAPLHGGEYMCVVINDAGVGMATSVLNVIVEVVTHPQSINTTADSNFNLTCIAEAFPYPTIEWIKTDSISLMEETLPGQNKAYLEFEPVRYNDFGMYKCVARNDIGEESFVNVSDQALVTVSPEGSIDVTPVNMTFDYQEEVNITCNISGGPMNAFTWFLNDTEIVPESNNIDIINTLFASTLTISSINAPAHGGEYKCEASNAAGLDQHATPLYVGPRITEFPAPQTLTVDGSNATLICRAEAFPTPRYLWYDENDISQPIMDPEPLLKFEPAVFGNEGIYICIVSSNGLTLNTSGILHVSPFGSVNIMPSVINGIHDNDISTECSASGGLNNQFQWIYLRTGDIPSNETTLNIINLNVLNGGTYECTVTNPAGNETEQFELNVAPRILEDPVSANYSIQIEDIVLNCTVSGYPIPSVRWFHNSTEIEEDTRTNITNIHMQDDTNLQEDFGIVVSELVILNADVNDTGPYYCEADIGIVDVSVAVSDIIEVLVQDVPQSPHSLDSEDVYSRNLTLIWAIPHDNNAPILGNFIFYRNPFFIENGSDVLLTDDDNVGEFIVENLHPGEFYNFTIIAFNEEGNSAESDTYRVRTLEEEPDGFPQNLRGQPLTATQVSLNWEPLMIQNRLGVITLYDVMYTAQYMNGTIIETKLKGYIVDTFTILNGLHEYTNYTISVRARTAVGPGPFSSSIIMVLTNETFPGIVDLPSINSVSSTSAVLTWKPPVDPNGMIRSYNVQIDPISFNMDPFASSRRRRQINEDLLNCYQFLNQTHIIRLNVFGLTVTASLIPFTNYQMRVSANTIIGSGNFSSYNNFSTPEDDRGVIINLIGTTRNATSVVLSWDAPPCPNGLIVGYHVYYRLANYTQSVPIDSSLYASSTILSRDPSISKIIFDLTPGQNYSFHVRAFYNESEPGLVDLEIVLKLNSLIVLDEADVQAIQDRINPGSRDLLIGLPSLQALESIGITNVQFYGVVVVPDPDSNFMLGVDDFDTTHPDLQPYDDRGSNRYYIAAGWNNGSLVPEDFTAGDERVTTAFRNGIEERYFNAELKPLTTYCFYVLLNHMSEVGNEVVVRYAELSCQETERGYNLVGLIVGLILTFLLLLCCILFVVIICCWCRRRRKRYSFEELPKSKVQESHLLIKNPAFQFERKETQIALVNYPVHVEYMHSNNDTMFSHEYSVIEPHHDPTTDASEANRTKNRFNNFPAYDHSRVVLTETSNNSDYINASYIKGYEGSCDFIATQGPMGNTADDFWSMIWEQNVTTIVMLTPLERNNHMHCYKYWPDFMDGDAEYDLVNVMLKEEMNEGSYVERSFTITKKGFKPKTVHQLQYIAWNEESNPKNCEDLLIFIQNVKEKYTTQTLDGPIVVHCSSGVGRTGMFIALLTQLKRAEKEKSIDIYRYVQYMRQQRPSMVLNEIQYIFVHDALLEAINQGMIKDVAIENPYIIQ